jgi:hypothetical protein
VLPGSFVIIQYDVASNITTQGLSRLGQLDALVTGEISQLEKKVHWVLW